MRNKNVKSAMTTVISLFALGVLFFSGVSPAFAASPDSALQTKGEALLRDNCSRCHAIGPSDVSSHKQAPPFRDVILRYPAENLAEALAEGIVSGHPDMPVLTFEVDQIDAIIAYLNTLNGTTVTP